MSNRDLFSRKLLLRATLKILTSMAVIWVGYILTAGFFPVSEKAGLTQYEFDLLKITDNSAAYFKVDERELLVINRRDEYLVFWAQDPVYGCRLEFFTSVIKPVCINIEYNLDGFSAAKNQQLRSPDYKINDQRKLQIF